MQWERLQPRTLTASVRGTVWFDADASATFDAREAVARGAAVYLDANANGRYDAGEPQEKTDRVGRYAFDDLPAGEYLVGVVYPDGVGQTTPGRTGGVAGGFDITLTGTDGLDPAVRRAFADAAARWERVIVGDLPDVGGVDDVTIAVDVRRIDGRGGTLARAGPNDLRSRSFLPYTGDMEFDSADVPGLIDDGTFADTVTHEMAHVLGFGTIWSDLGLLRGEGTRTPLFTGRSALTAYRELFGTTVSVRGVPVENRGGDGTADSHWPESSFAEELMTGFDERDGVAQPMSRITVGQFADLGYAVDLRAADRWDPQDHTATLTTPLDLGARPFERRVAVVKGGTADGVDFGLRADTAPSVGRVTAADATLGRSVRLQATSVSDAEGDDVVGVGFYAEANGRPGLQGGRGGDSFLADAVRTRGVWSANAPTIGLSPGTQTYYAVATDALGLSGRRSATAEVVAPPPPVRPSPLIATRQARASTFVQWRDRSADEIGFRVELSDDPDYATRLRAFNVPADTPGVLLDGLARGTTYYVRVRAYGYGGASAYTRLSGVRV